MRTSSNFFVINTDDGSIEYGFEPYFDEAEKVADSLEEFWEKAVSGKIERFLDDDIEDAD